MQYVEEKARDPEDLQKLPGITCYFVKPGDTLWDIAKKFYTTTDKIRELNELKTETLTPMQRKRQPAALRMELIHQAAGCLFASSMPICIAERTGTLL